MLRSAISSPQPLAPIALARPACDAFPEAALARTAFAILVVAGFVLWSINSSAVGADKYFDASAGEGYGVGGSATFGTTFSTVSTGSATLTTATSGDALIFQGAAGVVTLGGTTFPAGGAFASSTFNVTNFTLTAAGTTRVYNSSITLASNVNLNLLDSTTTSERALSIGGSITGAPSGSLTIIGIQNGANAARINLSVANSTISVPIVIKQAGGGFAGIVATAAGQQITGTITNNAKGSTLLGATDASDLTVSGTISGTGGLRIAAGSGSGGIGGGVVTLNTANSYTGPTVINNSSSGVLRIGVNDALSTASSLTLGGGGSSTGALDLNGHDQAVTSLSSTVNLDSTVNGITNTSGTTQSTLTINGSAATSYSGVIGVLANTTNLAGQNNNIAVTLAATNTGTQLFSGNNTYTGTTTINGGTLSAANGGNGAAGGTIFQALGGTSAIIVRTGGTLLLEASNQINDLAAIELADGTIALNDRQEGAAGVNGAATLTLTTTSTLDFGAGEVGESLIQFAAIGGAMDLNDGIVLQINNWQGTPITGGGPERLLFAGSASAFTSRYAQNEVTFDGAEGYNAVQFGNYYEITTGGEIPEPATVFAGLMLLGMVGCRERQRLAQQWTAWRQGRA